MRLRGYRRKKRPDRWEPQRAVAVAVSAVSAVAVWVLDAASCLGHPFSRLRRLHDHPFELA
jgi:hypothetical protein